MSYADGEALWLTRLRAMSAYDTTNSGRGTYGMLNSGKADRYAILKPGDHERQMIAPTTRWNIYRTVISLYRPWRDDGTTLTNLEADVDAVLTEMDKYRHLNDSTVVTDANIATVREFVALGPPDTPVWLRADLIGEWYEEEELTYSD